MKNFILIALVALSFGTLSAQICVGEPGKVQWQCWRNLYAAEYSELSALEFYPNTPDITQTIYSLNAPVNYDNNMGVKISGFIHVPVTDSVTFNITGNRRCRFYLSTTSSPSNLVLRASAPDNTNEYEYTKYPEQTSIKLRLLANLYYYFEIQYVEDTGSDHCKLFGKTTFYPVQTGILSQQDILMMWAANQLLAQSEEVHVMMAMPTRPVILKMDIVIVWVNPIQVIHV
ncbi:MAG: hypothetical protein IPO92_02135 [Saprospiraceae bacterium]|nr:hypothetical protein [Saprospiraceae bacterium]